jgi:hypothetical protein
MITINGQILTGTVGNKGNTKTGKQVTITMRQAGATCPGASPWCRELMPDGRPRCYAEGKAYNRYSNLQQKYSTNPMEFPKRFHPQARIHVSGDFDSVEYIDLWIQKIQDNPSTNFWAYTRSWNVPYLLPKLEELRALPNMQLFASTDVSMPTPPAHWRVAYIVGDTRFRGMPCLEQTGKMPDCQTCGYCFNKPAGNVGFLEHK